ncbi:hypothetical protein J6590_103057, partial [Homalodisca vitripennis]
RPLYPLYVRWGVTKLQVADLATAQKKPVGKLALFFPHKSSNKWSGSTDLPLQTQRRCGEWRAKTPHQWTRRDGLIHFVCYPELALTVAGLTALWAQPGAGETFQCKIVLILQNNNGNTSRNLRFVR